MINGIQICDSNGLPFYVNFYALKTQIEGSVLSGLISAIGFMSMLLFKQDIASISFGDHEHKNQIIIIQKDLFQSKKKIFFVFFVSGKTDLSYLRRISTALFIEGKHLFQNRSIDVNIVSTLINRTLNRHFAEISTSS
jgi:hypothetical protein